MKRHLIFLMVFLYACGGSSNENTTEEVQKDSNIIVSDSVISAPQDSVIIDTKLTFLEKTEQFRNKYLRWYSEQEIRKSILPERFSSDTVIRFCLRKNTPVNFGDVKDVYPIADLYFFSYSDTVTQNNALNNWLNCFGMDCTPVVMGEDMKAIKTTPSYTIITPQEIIHLQYQCEHVENDWEVMIRELDLLFAVKGSKRIRVECGGPLRWK